MPRSWKFWEWHNNPDDEEAIDIEDPPRVRYQFVSREEWDAEPPGEPKELVEIENTPVEIVLFVTTETRKCKSKETCCRLMREIQRRDRDRGLPDVCHNFYIGGDGNVYEGRGWKIQRSKLEEDDFLVEKSITLGFMGKFQDKDPSKKMFLAAYNWVKYGVDQGYFVHHVLFNSHDIKHPI